MALHPFISNMLDALSDRPALSDGSPQDARELVAAGRAALGASVEVEEVRSVDIDTRAGRADGLLVIPGKENPAGLIVYVHGGGWVVGSPDDFAIYARALARESGCAVLLPRYRLAPEEKFPAGLEDVEDALLWARRNVVALAGHKVPIVAAGDSAGGNLVTVALRRLGSRMEVALQVLIYPVTDTDTSRPSYGEFGRGLTLSARDMRWFFDHYTTGPLDHPDIAPMQADNLSMMPRTVIVLASHDVLRDEGRAYADRLRDAGVDVTLREVPGMTHGFIRLHNHVDVSAQELKTLGREVADVCRAKLENPDE